MPNRISQRLLAIVDALPLKAGIRVIEIGCGPGTALLEIALRETRAHLLGVDRSDKAIAQARRLCASEVASGRITLKRITVEDLTLEQHETPYDLAFAIRVGVLDGRHPERNELALSRIKAALKPNGRLFIDGGDPLIEIHLGNKPKAAR